MSSSSSDLEAVEASLHEAVTDFFKSDEGTLLVSTQVIQHLHSKKGKALLSKIVGDALDSKPSADVTPRKDKSKTTRSKTVKSPPTSVKKVKDALHGSKRACVASSSSSSSDDDDDTSSKAEPKEVSPPGVPEEVTHEGDDFASDLDDLNETSIKYLTAILTHDVPAIFCKWNFVDKCSDGKNAQEWPVAHYDTSEQPGQD